MNFNKIIVCILGLCIFSSVQAQNIDSVQISSENVLLLEEVALYGDGTFIGTSKWSPDGMYVAMAGTRGAWIFPADDFQNPIFLEHASTVTDVTWSSDATTLTTITSNERQIWSVVDWTIQDISSGADKVAYSPDGRYRVETILEEAGNTGLDTVAVFTLYDNWTGEADVIGGDFETMENNYYTTGYAVFTHDSAYLLTVFSCYLFQYCENSTYFSIWSINDSSPTVINELIVGQSVIALGDSRIAYINEDRDIIILDIDSGETQTLSDYHPFQLGYSGTNLVVLTSENIRHLNFIDPLTGEVLWSLPFPNIWNFALSLEGNQLVVADDQHMYLFDLLESNAMQRSSYTLTTPDYSLFDASEEDLADQPYPCARLALDDGTETRCGAYNFDETYFAGETYCDAKCVYLWELDTFAPLYLLEVDPNDFAGNFVFFTDTATFAFEVADCFANMRCTSSTVYLWNINQTSPIAEIPTGVVNQLFFASNIEQNLLVAVTFEAIVFIDTETGELLTTLYNSASDVIRAAFSDDGTQFFTRHYDDTVRVWTVQQ